MNKTTQSYIVLKSVESKIKPEFFVITQQTCQDLCKSTIGDNNVQSSLYKNKSFQMLIGAVCGLNVTP
jgi:hypothetical protein